MNFKTFIYSFLLILILVPISSGCSRENPVSPDSVKDNSLPLVSEAGQSGAASERSLLGVWEATFDVNSMTAKVEPVRSADFHLNILPYIQRPTIYVRSWNPSTETVDVDVSIYNSSVYIGYDVRLIILNDTIGHKLLNPDNYTHLWDIPEGTWANGFKAYGKDHANRYFHSQAAETENFQIRCPGANFAVKFAIDASWPLNCSEPYLMNNFTQEKLPGYAGASATISIDVYDWQNDVESVRIQCSAITGQTDTYFPHSSGLTWHLNLQNNTGAPEGDYLALIAAGSANTGDQLIELVTIHVSNPDDGYAFNWGGNEGFVSAEHIAIDDEGSIYIFGEYTNTIDVDPDPNIENDTFCITDPEQPTSCAYLEKFDRQGSFEWFREFGDMHDLEAMIIDQRQFVILLYVTYLDYPPRAEGVLRIVDPLGNDISSAKWGGIEDTAFVSDVCLDNENNFIIAGNFSGTIDFNPSTSETDYRNSVNGSAFVTKLNANLDYSWANTFEVGDDGSPKAIDTTSMNSIYCCGWISGGCDLNPGSAVDYHVSLGNEDAFLSKFTADGDYLWGTTWGGLDDDHAMSCTDVVTDNVLIAGVFQNEVDFNPDPNEIEIRSAIWADDAYVSIFSPDGNFLNVMTIGSMNEEEITQIIADGNDCYYIFGQSGIADFDPGPDDVTGFGRFIAKYTIDLDYQWVRFWDYDLYINGMVLDQDSNSYFCGKLYGDIDLDPGPAEFIIYKDYGSACVSRMRSTGYWE
jgi:hypothetical protein